MWKTWVLSLGREEPLEKEMVTHSSILAWRIPWTEEPDGLQSTGLQRVGHDWATSLSVPSRQSTTCMLSRRHSQSFTGVLSKASNIFLWTCYVRNNPKVSAFGKCWIKWIINAFNRTSSISKFLEFPYYKEADHKIPLRNTSWGKYSIPCCFSII